MNYVPDTTLTEMFWTGTSRLNRMRFLKRNLALVGVLFITILAIFMALFITSDTAEFTDELLMAHPAILIALIVAQVLYAVVGFKLDVRRLKDLGKGKLLAVISLVLNLFGAVISSFPSPIIAVVNIVSLLIAFYLLLTPGQVGANQYGADPLG